MFQENTVALQLVPLVQYVAPVSLARILVKVLWLSKGCTCFLTGCCHKLRMSWETTDFTFFAGVMYKVCN